MITTGDNSAEFPCSACGHPAYAGHANNCPLAHPAVEKKQLEKKKDKETDETDIKDNSESKSETNISEDFIDTRNDRIKYLKSKPEKIARLNAVDWDAEPEQLNELISLLKHANTFYDNLRKNYHINIPETDDPLLEKNENGTTTVITIVDRIDGQAVTDIKSLPEANKDKIDLMLSGLTDHYIDAYKNNGEYLWDLTKSQFMYGHTKKNPEDSLSADIWLADVDPTISQYKKGEENANYELFIRLGRDSLKLIKEIESKFPEGAKLEKARQKILDAINSIPATEPYYNILQETKDELEGVEKPNYY